MIAMQLLLSLGLLAASAYAYTHRDLLKVLARLMYGATVIGLWFVWSPDEANQVAHALGIGRGADLLLYCWVLVSTVVLLNLHLKLRGTLRLTTELARQVALLAPLEPRERAAQRLAAE
jgi:hypothetical protein